MALQTTRPTATEANTKSAKVPNIPKTSYNDCSTTSGITTAGTVYCSSTTDPTTPTDTRNYNTNNTTTSTSAATSTANSTATTSQKKDNNQNNTFKERLVGDDGDMSSTPVYQ
eukprot:5303254-Amphidinium_carterae.1